MFCDIKFKAHPPTIHTHLLYIARFRRGLLRWVRERCCEKHVAPVHTVCIGATFGGRCRKTGNHRTVPGVCLRSMGAHGATCPTTIGQAREPSAHEARQPLPCTRRTPNGAGQMLRHRHVILHRRPVRRRSIRRRGGV